jgi:hypothetical protein
MAEAGVVSIVSVADMGLASLDGADRGSITWGRCGVQVVVTTLAAGGGGGYTRASVGV